MINDIFAHESNNEHDLKCTSSLYKTNVIFTTVYIIYIILYITHKNELYIYIYFIPT